MLSEALFNTSICIPNIGGLTILSNQVKITNYLIIIMYSHSLTSSRLVDKPSIA